MTSSTPPIAQPSVLQPPVLQAPVLQAVVLVGGKGARLGPLTAATPKPLLEIAPGQRFLDTLLFELARHGFSDIILLAGHLGDQFEAAYQNRRVLGAAITVIREPEPQGTAGALRLVADRLDPWFVMTNGDSLFEFNLRALTANPNPAMIGRLALREVPDARRFGTVDLTGERITAFREKDAANSGPALINGGVYLLNRSILDRIHALPSGPASIEQDIFPTLAHEGRLEGRAFTGYFLDIGLPETYAQAQAEIPVRRLRPALILSRALVTREAAPVIRQFNEARWYVFAAGPPLPAGLDAQLAEAGAHIDAAASLPALLSTWPVNIGASALVTPDDAPGEAANDLLHLSGPLADLPGRLHLPD